MKRTRVLAALTLTAMLAIIVVVMAAFAPALPQTAAGKPAVLVTAIPLPGQEPADVLYLDGGALEVSSGAGAYIASDPLQSPLETPMP